MYGSQTMYAVFWFIKTSLLNIYIFFVVANFRIQKPPKAVHDMNLELDRLNSLVSINISRFIFFI